MAKVLLIEDDLAFAIPEDRALRDAGHDVHWTDASEVAWAYLCAGHPDDTPFDIVILDVNYVRRHAERPTFRGEGLALLRRMRQDPGLRDLPVIGVSCWLVEDPHVMPWRDQFDEAGGDLYFEQPVDPDDLIQAVDELTAKRAERTSGARPHRRSAVRRSRHG